MLLWVFLITLSAMPIITLVFLCKNQKQLETELVTRRYGALYDGLNVAKSAVIFYTPIFMIRRITFALVVCLLHGFVWVQLSFQFLCILTFSSYLVAYRPLISKKALGLELLNELTEALLLYHLLIFSDWNPNDAVKDTMANSFNFVIFINICIHLGFLVYAMVTQTRQKIRRKQCICQKKKPNSAKVDKDEKPQSGKAS